MPATATAVGIWSVAFVSLTLLQERPTRTWFSSSTVPIELWQMAGVSDVMRVPTLVANGMQTDVEIGSAFGRTGRQGRYMIKGGRSARAN